MATYEVETPAGVVSVEAPEGASDKELIERAKPAAVARWKRMQAGIDPDAQPAPEDPTAMGHVGEFFRQIPAGAVNMMESAAVGASGLAPDDMQPGIREGIESVADTLTPEQRPQYEDSLAGSLGQGIGSTIPLMGMSLFGPAGVGAAVGTGVAAGSGEARMRAEQHPDATEEDVEAAALRGTMPGALEFLPPLRILRRVAGPAASNEVFSKLAEKLPRTGRVSGAAAEEGLQEAISEAGQNIIAKGLYDPEEGVFTDTGESFGVGAGVGGMLQGLAELFIRNRGPSPDAPDTEEGPSQLPLRGLEEGDVEPSTVRSPGVQGELFPEGTGVPASAQQQAGQFDDEPSPEQGDLFQARERDQADIRDQMTIQSQIDRARMDEARQAQENLAREEAQRAIQQREQEQTRQRARQEEAAREQQADEQMEQQIGAADATAQPENRAMELAMRQAMEEQGQQAQQRGAQEPEYADLSEPETPEMLAPEDLQETLRIPPSLPVGRRVAGRDLTDTETRNAVRDDLSRHIQNPVVQRRNPERVQAVQNFLQSPLFQDTDTEAAPQQEGTEDAVQEQSPEEVPALPETEDGQEVGAQVRQTQQPPTEEVQPQEQVAPQQEAPQEQAVPPLPPEEGVTEPLPEDQVAPGDTPTPMAGRQATQQAAPDTQQETAPEQAVEPTQEAGQFEDRIRGMAEEFASTQEDQSTAGLARDVADHALTTGRRMRGEDVQEMAQRHNVSQQDVRDMARQPFSAEGVREAERRGDPGAQAWRQQLQEQDTTPEQPAQDTTPAEPQEETTEQPASTEQSTEIEATEAAQPAAEQETEATTQAQQETESTTGTQPRTQGKSQKKGTTTRQKKSAKPKTKTKKPRKTPADSIRELPASEPTPPARVSSADGKVKLDTHGSAAVRTLKERKTAQGLRPEARAAHKYIHQYDDIGMSLLSMAGDIVIGGKRARDTANTAKGWVDSQLGDNASQFLNDSIEELRVRMIRAARMDKERYRSDRRTTAEREQAANYNDSLPNSDEWKDISKAIDKTYKEIDPDGRLEMSDDSGVLPDGENLDQYLANNPVAASTARLHPVAVEALYKRDLKGALDSIAQSSNNLVGRLAKTLRDNMGDTKVQVVKQLTAPDNTPASGVYEAANNTIKISEEIGMTPHAVMHEATHALTVHAVNTKPGGDPIIRQLKAIFDTVSELSPTAYGSQNMEEFIAEAFSNPSFQAQLHRMTEQGKPLSAWRRFANAVTNMLRRMMGMPMKDLRSARDKTTELISTLLSPTPQNQLDKNFFLANHSGAYNPMDWMGSAVRAAGNMPKSANEQYWATKLQQPWDKTKSFILDAMPLDHVARYAEQYIPRAMDVFHKVLENNGTRDTYIQQLRSTVKWADNQIKDIPGAKEKLDDLVMFTTTQEVNPMTDGTQYTEPQAKADYKQAKKMWNQAPDAVRRVYRAMHDSYKKLYDDLLNELDNRIENADLDDVAKASLKDRLLADLLRKGRVDPYFPLRRRGRFWLSYQAVDSLTGNPETFVEAFETEAEWRAAEYDLKNNSEHGATDVQTFVKIQDLINKVPSAFVYNVIHEVDKNHNLPGNLKEELLEIMLRSMPESSYIKGLRRREGTPGAIKDSMKVMQDGGMEIIQQIVNAKYGGEFAQLKEHIDDSVEKTRNTADNVPATDYANRLKEFMEYSTNPELATWSKVTKSMAFLYTLGAHVSSVAINLTNVPAVVLQFLGGKFGFRKAYRAMGKAIRLYSRTGGRKMEDFLVPVVDENGATVKEVNARAGWSFLNLDYSDPNLDPELKAMEPIAKALRDFGYGNRSMTSEWLDLHDARQSWYSKMNTVSGFMFHHGERATRHVSAATSFILQMEEAKAQGKRWDEEAQQAAVRQAMEDAETTNSGAMLTTAPKLARSNVGSVVMMYKRFGISMYALQFQLARDALNEIRNGTERKKATRQLVGIMGASGLMAGVQGMPAYGIIIMLANLFLLDDDEPDADTIVRSTIGEFFYGGSVNAMTGTDVAGRISLTNMLFRSQPNQNQEDLIKRAAEMIGGPAVGIASRIDSGIQMMGEGQYRRGMERMTPSALSNLLKSYRYYDEGAMTMRGDPITAEVSPWNIFAQAMGFIPADYSRQLDLNMVSKRIDRSITNKRTSLLRQLNVSRKLGDWQTAAEARQDIAEFNQEVHPEARITAETIQRSWRQHQNLSQEMKEQGGVSYSNINRRKILQDQKDWFGTEED